MTERITSTRNPAVLRVRALSNPKAREAQQAYMIEGPHMLEEALESGCMPEIVLLDEGDAETWHARLLARGVPVALCTRAVIEAASDTRTPQSVVAVLRREARPIPESARRLIALDGVQDPGNVGTIWRTAEAAGFEGLLLGAGCADAYAPKTLRASMGAVFRVPVEKTEDLAARLAARRAQGSAVLVSALEGEDFFRARPKAVPVVLVVGSEGAGVSQTVKAIATQVLRMPMAGNTESLNAAVAAGIMMYAYYLDAE